MHRVAVVHITADPRVDPRCMAGDETLWRRLDTAVGQPIPVRAGRREVALQPSGLQLGAVAANGSNGSFRHVAAYPNGSAGGGSFFLRVNPRTLRDLALPPEGVRCHVKLRHRDDGPTLQLGPFLGVFGQRGGGPAPFGGHELYFRALSANGRALAVPTYVFSARDVDLNRGVVRGFRWFRQGRARGWTWDMFPVPDAVYDRLTTRRAELMPAIRSVRRRLQDDPNITYFNPGFFDKWAVHSKLARHPDLEPYLPATEKFQGGEGLAAFLRRWGTVFLKPAGGSLGLGIIAVNRRRDGYRCRFCTRAGMLLRHYATFDGLLTALRRYMGRRDYVMQQGIRLMRWGGRTFDIRLLMQKDAGGRWQVTKSYARVAPFGSPTSNLSTGGIAAQLERVLRAAAGRSKARRIADKIRECALNLAPVIESQIGATLGEMGLDLALDRTGQLWILEVNSKPYVQMTRGSGSPLAIRLSALRPIRWARYATGFEPEETAESREPVLS